MCAVKVWVGQLPEGVDGFEAVSNLQDVPEASLVVIGPPPRPWAVRSWVKAQRFPVVACFDAAPDPFTAHAWHTSGAWCVVREHATPAELEGVLARIERQHGPSLEARARRAFSLQPNLSLTFKSLDDAEHVAMVLSFALPNPDRRMAGIVELLVNAIEHGNLELRAGEKQALLEQGLWRREIDRRLATSPWCDRSVTATLATDADGWVITVEDMGPGFGAATGVAVGPSDLRGRGIAVARAAFDTVQWEAGGKRVVARVLK